MPSRRQRDEYLSLARRDIDDAIRSVEGDASGFLAIRGHILLTQGHQHEAFTISRKCGD